MFVNNLEGKRIWGGEGIVDNRKTQKKKGNRFSRKKVRARLNMGKEAKIQKLIKSIQSYEKKR